MVYYLFSIFKNAGTQIFKVYVNLSSDIRANIIEVNAIKYANKDPTNTQTKIQKKQKENDYNFQDPLRNEQTLHKLIQKNQN